MVTAAIVQERGREEPVVFFLMFFTDISEFLSFLLTVFRRRSKVILIGAIKKLNFDYETKVIRR